MTQFQIMLISYCILSYIVVLFLLKCTDYLEDLGKDFDEYEEEYEYNDLTEEEIQEIQEKEGRRTKITAFVISPIFLALLIITIPFRLK